MHNHAEDGQLPPRLANQLLAATCLKAAAARYHYCIYCIYFLAQGTLSKYSS